MNFFHGYCTGGLPPGRGEAHENVVKKKRFKKPIVFFEKKRTGSQWYGQVELRGDDPKFSWY